MNRESPPRSSRRDELIARCQQERYELVAATATTVAMMPRARRLAHWIRAMSRLLRVISANLRAAQESGGTRSPPTSI
jgi:hypothetical protein